MAHQARKRFGQHFLTDSSIINAIIARIHPGPQDRVIEIGPGLGAMTFPLLDQGTSLEVVEIDRDLIEFWQKKNLAQLSIYQADALDYDFANWAKTALDQMKDSQSNGRVKIVGNLPYNISTPLLFHLIDAIEYVDEQIFMLQKEVIDRMVAQPGDSEYGRLSVMLQIRYHLELCFEVPPSAFEPPPKVNSAIVAMYPKKDVGISPLQWNALEKIVAKAFSQRRKVLANNLGEYKDLLELDQEVLRSRAQDIDGPTYLSWANKLVQANQV
jgi:16S rRNA (adenine1518-N6/adenine1519-N6)-dimethyltransferase